MEADTLPGFARFIEDLRATWARLDDDESRMKEGQRLLKALLSDAELIAHSRNWPSTEGRKNLLFYEDPDYGFAINGVVRQPGRTEYEGRTYARGEAGREGALPSLARRPTVQGSDRTSWPSSHDEGGVCSSSRFRTSKAKWHAVVIRARA